MVKYFKNKRSVFNQQDILCESAKLEEKKDTLRRGPAEVDISLTILVLKGKGKKIWEKDIFSRDELSWEDRIHHENLFFFIPEQNLTNKPTL